MSLPIFDKITSIFQKSPKHEFFVVFLVESKFIKIAVWEKNQNGINITKIVKEEFSGSLEDLIETADRAISKASYGIPQEELSKVIFSVPSAWSIDGKIQSNYLQLLKNVCVSLSLKPLGFVITTEAIVKAMENSESLKINYLLLHIGSEILNLSYIEHGNLTETVSSLRSENSVGDDLLELLSRFKATTLPTKIIIFDGVEDLEKIKQEIIKSPITQKEKRFLHFPTVEALGENADITAVIHTVGGEIGVKIQKTAKVHEAEKTTIQKDETIKEKTEEIQEKPEDVKPNKTQEPAFDKQELDIESLGFYIDKDIAEEKEKKPVVEETKQDNLSKKSIDISSKKAILLILGFVFSIIFFIFLFWLIFGSADVVLGVTTKKFTNQTAVTLQTVKNSKLNNSILGKEITVASSGEMTAQATGKKKTGEKAKGEVVVFNKSTEGDKTFPKGTLISDGNLKFLTDEEVKVASASIKIEAGSETKIFGKASVSITAEKFGNEYNVEDNKDWSVDNFAQSSFSAHNDRAFSGGTTKEIQVVSESDKEKLQIKLEKSLDQKAHSQVEKKIDVENEEWIGTFVEKKILEKKFSVDKDEEAKNFTLSMEIDHTTFSYLKKDAKNILDKILIGKIPEGLFLNQKSISLKLNSVKEATDGYDLNFTYNATAIPKINLDEIKNKIKFKPISSLDKFLITSEIKNYSVKTWPPLPFLSKILPRAGKIKITLKY